MGDQLPQSPAGIVVSVADKVDSLVGLVGAGCAPSASADPYGLRRTAVGLLQVGAMNSQHLQCRPIPVFTMLAFTGGCH